jgi:hypothetical protein
MIERLKAFQAKSNQYPERIVVYRDGISEVSLSSSIVKVPREICPFRDSIVQSSRKNYRLLERPVMKLVLSTAPN